MKVFLFYLLVLVFVAILVLNLLSWAGVIDFGYPVRIVR